MLDSLKYKAHSEVQDLLRKILASSKILRDVVCVRVGCIELLIFQRLAQGIESTAHFE